jgi:hypothetical protein
MYKSPVVIIYGQMQTKLDGDILRAVQSYGINVDKEELIRALQYDRGQYYKGYEDGKNDAMNKVVRCKDCKNYIYSSFAMGMRCKHDGVEWGKDDFCSYGERKDNA